MPLVLKKSGSVFLHPMKTGGTWVRVALECAGVECEDVGYQHADYKNSDAINPESERFTIIRNPFEWYRSFFAFRDSKGWGGDLPIGHHCKNESFEHFILLCCKKYPGYLTKYLSLYTAETVFVLRNETSKQGLIDFLECVGEDFDKQKLLDTPKANRSACLPEYDTTVYSQTMVTLLVQSEWNLFVDYNYPLTPPKSCNPTSD